MACEVCGTRVAVGQLAQHVAERCAGPPNVSNASRWVRWREILDRGVPKYVAANWVKAGRLRYVGEVGERRYLLRDVDTLIAHRARRRDAMQQRKPATKRAGKRLTKRPSVRQLRRMVDHLPAATARRLRAFAERMGSLAAAGRELKIPADTLGRALRGENIRRGTRILIETQLNSASKGGDG